MKYTFVMDVEVDDKFDDLDLHSFAEQIVDDNAIDSGVYEVEDNEGEFADVEIKSLSIRPLPSGVELPD